MGKEKLENPYASIIYQKDLSDFPPVVTVVGEYDFLRFSTDIFTKRCVDYGKLRRTIRYQGCDHGFFDMIGVMPQAGRCDFGDGERYYEFVDQKYTERSHRN